MGADKRKNHNHSYLRSSKNLTTNKMPSKLTLLYSAIFSILILANFEQQQKISWGLTSAAPQSVTVDASPGFPSSSSSLPFDPSSLEQLENKNSSQLAPTTNERKVVEITSKHLFWFNGQSKLCDLLREATNVTKLDWNNIVLRNKEQNHPPPLFNLVLNCTQLMNSGTGSGNWISAWYHVRIAATLAGVDLSFQCREGMQNHKNELLPWFTGYYPAPKSSDDWPLDFNPPEEYLVCNVGYPRIPLNLASHIIQSDMRRIAVAVMGDRGYDTSDLDLDTIKAAFDNDAKTTNSKLTTLPLAPDVMLDEVAIHFRCGDVLGGFERNDYGLIKFDEYKRQISPTVKSIGIVTQPFNKTLLRAKDRSNAENCRKVVGVLVEYLEKNFPKSTINVRNSIEDTLPITYGRLIMAKQTITGHSTFSIYPAMGTFGDGYFPVGSRLVNPFANARVPKALPNTHLMTTAPELGTGNIKKAGLDGTIKWLITPREEMNDTEFWESLTQ